MQERSQAVEVTTWFLEMLNLDEFRPAWSDRPDLVVQQAKIPSPELSRFLYASVGGDWYWCDRLSWTYDQWLTYLDNPAVQTWVAYVAGTPAGYVELHHQPQHRVTPIPEQGELQVNGLEVNSVEIAYFGLLKPFMGQGIGKHLLSVGIQQGWAMGGDRLWVHTCSLDGPHALKNYEARGFRCYAQVTAVEQLPIAPVGPWPGAYGG